MCNKMTYFFTFFSDNLNAVLSAATNFIINRLNLSLDETLLLRLQHESVKAFDALLANHWTENGSRYVTFCKLITQSKWGFNEIHFALSDMPSLVNITSYRLTLMVNKTAKIMTVCSSSWSKWIRSLFWKIVAKPQIASKWILTTRNAKACQTYTTSIAKVLLLLKD